LIGAGIAAAIIVLLLPIEIMLRFGSTLNEDVGIGWLDNLALGWYIYCFGVIVSLLGCALACSKRIRNIGLSDFFLLRIGEKEKELIQQEVIPQYYPSQPSPSQPTTPPPTTPPQQQEWA
jgi:hypothetical protein